MNHGVMRRVEKRREEQVSIGEAAMVDVEEAAKRIRAENDREAMILAERRLKVAEALFMSVLKNDLAGIEDSYALRQKAVVRCDASGWSDELDLMALGACLHHIYNAFEAYFLRIAKFFENNIDVDSWHRDLLERMRLEIPGIRPALLTDDRLAEKIDELRRFRHVFRNLYKTRLSAARLRVINEAAERCYEDFAPMHDDFGRWLDELGRSLGR